MRPLEDDRRSYPPKDESWQHLANCIGLPPEWFFPERGDAVGEGSDYRAAKEVCRGCEVRQECLEYAQTEPIEKWGLWGGLTSRERSKLRGRRVI